MIRTNLNIVVGFSLLIIAVTLMTVMGSYHFADKQYVVAAVPAGILVILLSMRYPQAIMLLLVALVPLDTFAELAGLSKFLTLTKILFPLALVGLIIAKMIGRISAPLPHRLDLWVLLWVGLNVILMMNAQDTDEARTYIRRLFSMGLFYYVLTRLFLDPAWNKRLQNTAILSAGLSVVFGLIAYSSGNNPFIDGYDYDAVRITGASHVSPNFYSIMLVLPLAIMVSYIFTSQTPRQTIMYMGGAAFLFVGIALSYSRSGFVAFAASMLLALVIWGRHVPAKYWLVTLAVSVVGLFFLPSEFWDRIASLNVFSSDKAADASLSNRFNYILVGINIVKDYPFFGSGPGNFQVLHALSEYQTKAYNIGEQRMPHNMYLQAITETGIAGLTVLLTLFISALMITVRGIKTHRHTRWLAGALFVALGGYLVMGVFSHLMLNKYLWVLLAMIRILPELEENYAKKDNPGLRAA